MPILMKLSIMNILTDPNYSKVLLLKKDRKEVGIEKIDALTNSIWNSRGLNYQNNEWMQFSNSKYIQVSATNK